MEKKENMEEEVAGSDDEGEEEVDTSQAIQELLKTETEIEIETDGEIKTEIETETDIKKQLEIAIETDRKIEKLGDRFEELEDFGYRRFYVKDYPYLYIAFMDNLNTKQYYLSMKVFKYVIGIQLPSYLLRTSSFDFSTLQKLPFRDKTTQLMTGLKNDEIHGVISEMKEKFNTMKWKQLRDEYGLYHRYETPKMHDKEEQKILLYGKSLDLNRMYDFVCGEIAIALKKEISVVKSVVLLSSSAPKDTYRFLMQDKTSGISIYYEGVNRVCLKPQEDNVPVATLLTGTKSKLAKFIEGVVRNKENTVTGSFSKLPKDKRLCGQDSVMGGISAKKFAAGVVNKNWLDEIRKSKLDYKEARFWEWLHLYAFSYGKCNYGLIEKQSPQDARNLVLGTANANTAMLVVESFLKGLLAVPEVVVNVSVTTSGLRISGDKKPIRMHGMETEEEYCSCVVQRISYRARVDYKRHYIEFESEFDPFDACPVPLIAVYFRKALAKWYIEKLKAAGSTSGKEMP